KPGSGYSTRNGVYAETPANPFFNRAQNSVRCARSEIRAFGMNSFDSFTIAPMSAGTANNRLVRLYKRIFLALLQAGDIIDRAIRLYRRNFLALLRIVLAPSLVAYAGSILMSIGFRNATLSKGGERIVITVLLVLGGFLLWTIGNVSFY